MGGAKKNLATAKDAADFRELQAKLYPGQSAGAVSNYAAQMHSFVAKMKVGDWVVVPSKKNPSIHVGEIASDYTFDAKAADPYFHHRRVKWIAQNVPRTSFEQDLLYSFGAFSTVCQISRNDAEKRVRAKFAGGAPVSSATPSEITGDEEVDFEQLARDQIAKLVIAKFKGHGLARLVGAILRAQGYTVHESPPGADKGIDLLAAPGPLGFGRPRICVQVKSSADPVDHPTLTQLIGAMHNSKADQGLLVSWGGFKTSVEKEIPAQFFQVRLWSQAELLAEMLANYDKLDATFRAEIPLKRIWSITSPDGEEV